MSLRPLSLGKCWSGPNCPRVAVGAWLGLYWQLGQFAAWLTYDLLGLDRHTHLASSVDFFATDVPKIFLLLGGIIPVVSVVRSYLPPERVKRSSRAKGSFSVRCWRRSSAR